MSAFIVTFEITDVKKVEALTAKLKTFNGYCPINQTTWGIISDKKASEIVDSLKESLDPSDRLFVIRSGTDAAWINSYGQQHADWLKKYL
jgi:hypothetical protein